MKVVLKTKEGPACYQQSGQWLYITAIQSVNGSNIHLNQSPTKQL